MQLLEDSFPDHSPLLPPKGAPQRDRADALMRLERRFFGSWLVRALRAFARARARCGARAARAARDFPGLSGLREGESPSLSRLPQRFLLAAAGVLDRALTRAFDPCVGPRFDPRF